MKVGVVGCGYWGGQIIRTLLDMEDVEIVALVDPSVPSRQAYAALVGGGVRTHSAFHTLLSDPLDGVIIASPPAYHVEQSIAALKKGKAVFLEKPPAMNLPDLDNLKRAARGKTLVCDFIYAYNPLVEYAKTLMADFELVHANLRWTNRGIVRRDVNAWWSVAPHPLSVLVYLFGQIRRESLAKGEGWAQARLVLPEGASRMDIFLSWWHPFKVRYVELVGRKKTIMISDVDPPKLWVVDHGSGAVCQPTLSYAPSPLENALRDFIACAKTGAEPICGFDMIEKVTRLLV